MYLRLPQRCILIASRPLMAFIDRVIGGDTVEVVLNGEAAKVGIAGIDAPELDQPFGEVARTLLATLVLWRRVSVESSERDKYRSDRAAIRARE